MSPKSAATEERTGGGGAILLLVVLFSFIVRLAVIAYFESSANRLHYWGYDESVYFSLARHMASTSPFDYTLRHSPLFFQEDRVWYVELPLFIHPPLFSWALMPFFCVAGGNFMVARFMNVLLGTASVFLTYSLGRRISKKVGVLSALLLSLSPLHLQLSSFVLMEMMLTVWVTLFVLSIMKTAESESSTFLILSGIALGAGMLTKYTMVCALPPLLLMAFGKKTRGVQWLGVLLIGGLLFFPWILWNYSFYTPSSILDTWRIISAYGNSTDVPFYAYLTFLPVVAPFTVISLASVFKRGAGEADRFLRDIFFCVIAGFLFFHMAHPIKEMRFILPVLPFMAVLAGDWLLRLGRRAFILSLILVIGFSLFADIIIIKENYLWYLDFWHYGDWLAHFFSLFSSP